MRPLRLQGACGLEPRIPVEENVMITA